MFKMKVFSGTIIVYLGLVGLYILLKNLIKSTFNGIKFSCSRSFYEVGTLYEQRVYAMMA